MTGQLCKQLTTIHLFSPCNLPFTPVMEIVDTTVYVCYHAVFVYITPSTLGLLPGISVYTGTKCSAKLRYYNLARSILVLQFEVDQALHLARANLAPHFT